MALRDGGGCSGIEEKDAGFCPGGKNQSLRNPHIGIKAETVSRFTFPHPCANFFLKPYLAVTYA